MALKCFLSVLTCFLLVSNPCLINPCQMDSICLLSSSDPSGRVCKCADDMVIIPDDKLGITCKSKPNVSNLCQLKCNRGTCKFVNNQQKCICPKDYDGDYCEKYRCSGYCRNKGTCYVDTLKAVDENQPPPLKCRCLPQWTGEKCEFQASICKVIERIKSPSRDNIQILYNNFEVYKPFVRLSRTYD